MSFIIRMALREVRASWQRLLFFFVCISVGVASIVAIRSVIQSVRAGLTNQAREMTGGDMVVRSNNPFTPRVQQTVAREAREGRITTIANTIEIATMVRPGDTSRNATKVVELLAVDEAYPLYGTLTLRQGTYSYQMLNGRGVLVRPELLAQLGLRAGDSVFIGTQPFEIRGVIASEPGRSLGAFSIGPRVIIARPDLAATGLLSFGSRASHEMLLRIPAPAITPVSQTLTEAFRNEFVGVRGYWQNADRMGENLTRAENYLSLVGLVVLILGGIGVSSVTRVFVQQKIRSVAILKCVGSSSRRGT